MNADLFRVHLANDPGCICGCAFEDTIHFILEWCLYNEAREELKLRLVILHELNIEVLLFDNDTLTEMQNLQFFKSVQLYIKRTKRFPIYDHNTPSHFFKNINPVASISHTSMIKKEMLIHFCITVFRIV